MCNISHIGISCWKQHFRVCFNISSDQFLKFSYCLCILKRNSWNNFCSASGRIQSSFNADIQEVFLFLKTWQSSLHQLTRLRVPVTFLTLCLSMLVDPEAPLMSLSHQITVSMKLLQGKFNKFFYKVLEDIIVISEFFQMIADLSNF